MQLVRFSPYQTFEHPYECFFLDYHMLKNTFSLNDNISDQFLQLMVNKIQQDLFPKSFGVQSFKMFKFIFYFLVLRLDPSKHCQLDHFMIPQACIIILNYIVFDNFLHFMIISSCDLVKILGFSR